MNQKTLHLHPIVLVLLAVSIGVSLNFGIWWVMHGYPPTVAGYYHSSWGCLGHYFSPTSHNSPYAHGHRPNALRDWIMNDWCALKAGTVGGPPLPNGRFLDEGR